MRFWTGTILGCSILSILIPSVSCFRLDTLGDYLLQFHRVAPPYYPSSIAHPLAVRAERFLKSAKCNRVSDCKWFLRHWNDQSTVEKYMFAPLLDDKNRLLTIKDQHGRLIPNLDVVMFLTDKGAFPIPRPVAIVRPMLKWESSRPTLTMRTVYNIRNWPTRPRTVEGKIDVAPELFYALALRDISQQNNGMFGKDVEQRRYLRTLENFLLGARKLPDGRTQPHLDIIKSFIESTERELQLTRGKLQVERPPPNLADRIANGGIEPSAKNTPLDLDSQHQELASSGSSSAPARLHAFEANGRIE